MNNRQDTISVLNELNEVNDLEVKAYGWKTDNVSGNREENQAYGAHKALQEILKSEEEDLVKAMRTLQEQLLNNFEEEGYSTKNPPGNREGNQWLGGYNVLTEGLSLIDGNPPTTIKGQIHNVRFKILGIIPFPTMPLFATRSKNESLPESQWFLFLKVEIDVLKRLVGTKREVFEGIIEHFEL